jgi:hypothetical protein
LAAYNRYRAVTALIPTPGGLAAFVNDGVLPSAVKPEDPPRVGVAAVAPASDLPSSHDGVAVFGSADSVDFHDTGKAAVGDAEALALVQGIASDVPPHKNRPFKWLWRFLGLVMAGVIVCGLGGGVTAQSNLRGTSGDTILAVELYRQSCNAFGPVSRAIVGLNISENNRLALRNPCPKVARHWLRNFHSKFTGVAWMQDTRPPLSEGDPRLGIIFPLPPCRTNADCVRAPKIESWSLPVILDEAVYPDWLVGTNNSSARHIYANKSPRLISCNLICFEHRFRGFARVFDRLQRGAQGALNKPNTKARDHDSGNSRDEHEQGIKGHVLLGLQVSICALLIALGLRLCAVGYNRGSVGDERYLRFVATSVGLVIGGGLLASLALTAGILLLR